MRLPVRSDRADQPPRRDQGRPAIISWIAQTFLQLVLLSIIMVGQSVQSASSDVQAAKQFADTETILDRLDVRTAGGITAVLDAINALANPAGASQAGAAQNREPD